MNNQSFVHVGTFGQPQGLKGDVKFNILTSSLVSFKKLKFLFIEDTKSKLVFKELRQVGKKIIASIDNCKDRDAALSFKGKHVFAMRDNFPKTKDNEYYVVDLIGCKVFDKKNNIIGIIEDIKNFGAGDLIEINNSNKKFYIPMNDDNLVSIDINKKKIIVDPLEGLLD